MQDEDHDSAKRAVSALGALVVVALVIGLVIGVGALLGARLLGVGGDTKAGPTSPASLYIPEGSDQPRPEAIMEPSTGRSPSASPSDGASDPDGLLLPDDQGVSASPRRPAKASRGLTLKASPRSVGVYERINLSGRYPGHDGTTLQVQRFESGWTNFPTSASVRGGRYATYVETGVSGVNRFRVVDTTTGRASAPVTVEVHG